MKGSASLLLPLHLLLFTTAAAASKKKSQPSCWHLFSAPFAAGASPCSGRRRIVVALQANSGKGFRQVAEEKPPPTSIGSDCSGGNGSTEDDDEIPQVVFERMIKRILFYVGAPMATGVGLLYLLDRAKSNRILDVPLWVPFLVILIGFGTSALGIAYGTLSASWDPEKEGSLLDWEEAQKNWPMLWQEDEGTPNVKGSSRSFGPPSLSLRRTTAITDACSCRSDLHTSAQATTRPFARTMGSSPPSRDHHLHHPMVHNVRSPLAPWNRTCSSLVMQ